MSSAFSKMKKSRMSFEQLSKKIEADSKGSKKSDERFYYPQLDENKNGSAVIRFLPPAAGEDDPWITVYSHGFKEKGGWLIEECPTTIGKDCPICTANSELWNSGIESDKDIVRKRKRRMQYMANILVVEDKKNPENEGKVFLFKFGPKIFDKVKGALHPEFDDEVAFNPFDFWEGANFKLRIRKFEGNVNYDKSEFAEQSPIAETDKEIEAIWNREYKLQDFLKEEMFKSYDKLEERLTKVLGTKAPTTTAAELADSQPSLPERSEPQKAPPAPKEEPAPSIDEDDDPMKYFRELSQED